MMMSVPMYNKYVDEVISPKLDQEFIKKIRHFEANQDYQNPEYDKLLQEHYYPKHVMTLPKPHPDVYTNAMNDLNFDYYLAMQGPSEFGIIPGVQLEKWDVTSRLAEIYVKTLFIGSKNDTMDPEHARENSEKVQNGKFHFCPKGGHCCMWDDEEAYFSGLLEFVYWCDGL